MENLDQEIAEFYKTLKENQTTLPEEFQKVLQENLWELYE